MFSPLIRKLGHSGQLTAADHDRLTEHARPKLVGTRQNIIEQGDQPEDVHLVLTGIACRYKVLQNGKRQIMALLVPGDFCDLHVATLGAMDHSVATLSPCMIAALPRATILNLTERHPRIARALLWATLVEAAISREWLVNIGLRPADQRLAHLFCELLMRLQVAGLANVSGYELPITQEDLSEVLGLTSVHVNRTLHTLRAAGLIVLQRRRLDIPDIDKLKAFCGFEPDYLHLAERLEFSACFEE